MNSDEVVAAGAGDDLPVPVVVDLLYVAGRCCRWSYHRLSLVHLCERRPTLYNNSPVQQVVK